MTNESSTWVDQELLDLAQIVTQAQERLHWKLNEKKQKCQYLQPVFDRSIDVIDKLRLSCSDLEGSVVRIPDITLDVSIRPLLLMHIPSSVTSQLREELRDKIESMMASVSKRVVFAALVTCPWYMSSQAERGQQARHNFLFILYQSEDRHFFNPLISNEAGQVIDKDQVHAVELYHFAHHLAKGKARYVDLFFLPQDAILLQTAEWQALRETLLQSKLQNLRGFIEQCRGQAMGSVGRKRKDGRFGLSEAATLRDFCSSFRLLHNVVCVLDNKPLHTSCLNNQELDLLPKQALLLVTRAFAGEQTTGGKQELFDLLSKWRDDLELRMAALAFTKPSVVEDALEKWLTKARLLDQIEPKTTVLSESDRERVCGLMKLFDKKLARLEPHAVIMICRAGSYLYGLNTSTSDTDYIIIYAEPIQRVISTCRALKLCDESRGPEKMLEYGAYEAAMFCDMLYKGSVVILEVLFADDLDYCSPAWKSLVEYRQLFVTEQTIRQYYGMIKNNLADIQHQRFQNTTRENKIFYQIFHKLYCLESLMQGEVPRVRMPECPEREFILRIRNESLKGDLTRDALYQRAVDKFRDLQTRHIARTLRLPEKSSPDFITNWLMGVRGWNT